MNVRRCVLLVALAVANPAFAVERYEGYAYTPDGTRLLYRETHWIYADEEPERLVLYRCPDGTPFARKRVTEIGVAHAPDFEFTDARDGHREGVRSMAGRRDVYWQDREGTDRAERPLSVAPDTVIDAGFDAYVRAHWDALAAGAPLSARLLLPSRLGTIGVRISDVTSPSDRRMDLRRMSVQLDAWYAFALPALSLVYDAQRTLREFRGIGPVRDRHGRNLGVVIRFPADPLLQPASRDEVEAAERAPLDGTCRL
ncbi:hypothetical protein [Dokdonella sp.]|uniref:hypothetical protein n=1 Tax=Dokdonella sp. TaxID=2291710 RepID=UPI002F3F43C7